MNDHPDSITDDETAGVITDTIHTIVLLRGRRLDTNAAAELDAITTLIRHARSRLPDLVADARDQANSWEQTAQLAGVSRVSVHMRYALHTRNRRQPLDAD